MRRERVWLFEDEYVSALKELLRKKQKGDAASALGDYFSQLRFVVLFKPDDCDPLQRGPSHARSFIMRVVCLVDEPDWQSRLSARRIAAFSVRFMFWSDICPQCIATGRNGTTHQLKYRHWDMDTGGGQEFNN
jgi:hypothetical protein